MKYSKATLPKAYSKYGYSSEFHFAFNLLIIKHIKKYKIF